VGEDGGHVHACGALDVHEEAVGRGNKTLELVLAGLRGLRGVKQIFFELGSGRRDDAVSTYAWRTWEGRERGRERGGCDTHNHCVLMGAASWKRERRTMRGAHKQAQLGGRTRLVDGRKAVIGRKKKKKEKRKKKKAKTETKRQEDRRKR